MPVFMCALVPARLAAYGLRKNQPPDGGADAIRATVKCTFTYCAYYSYMKRETAVSNFHLSDKVAVACSSRFRPRYQPGHRHDEVSILPAYVKRETAVSNCRLSEKVAITYSSAFAVPSA